MALPQVGVAILPYSNFLATCLPLFENAEIEVLEWPFDIFASEDSIPDWMKGLRDAYSQNDRLLGHGVYYSIFDAHWTERQSNWISRLKEEASNVKFNQITEHFGLMSSNDAHKGFPMPIVYSSSLLQIGVDRMKRLQDAAQVPIGLENLALAFSSEDVKEQGGVLEHLASSVNGFIILDLHNLYCQSQNFNTTMEQLMNSYPLDLVKEIHISGGSWSEVAGEKVRRDTHDNPVPAEVWTSLQLALQNCPNLEYIILEQLNNSLATEVSQESFRNDFMKAKAMVSKFGVESDKRTWGNSSKPDILPYNDLVIFNEQQELKHIFSSSLTPDEVMDKIHKLYPERDWQSKMVATGLLLADKWN